MARDWETLKGMVEIDETYLGGRRRKKGQISKRDPDDDQPVGRTGIRKSMVVVGVARGGKAKAKRGQSHGARTIAEFVYRDVDRGSVLLTDDLPAYRWIGWKFPAHLVVNRTKGDYVQRDPHAAARAHVNTAESLNAMLKRCWVGVHHWWSIKRSHRYLNQIVFYWNHRGADVPVRLAALFAAAGRRLRFKECMV